MKTDHFRSVPIVKFQRVFFGQVTHDVTVRRIGKGWNCRVLTNGIVNQESRVFRREHISRACAEMLRWEDKCGNLSKHAKAARARLNRKGYL